jgi:hypothetical protein
MKVPNPDEAFVAEDKIANHLLSPEHPVGRFKAGFFEGLGYDRGDWRRLADDLQSQHLTLDASEVADFPYGRKFVIEGPLDGPRERANLISVWVIRKGEGVARFVTAYPGR